jgi:hypothetical protein
VRFGAKSGEKSGGSAVSAGQEARHRAWAAALEQDRLPAFVEQRLQEARAGRLPWVATMTPAELSLARTHGIRPIATVSGTCWYSFGWSWTEGHAEGWHRALRRLGEEAVAAGAHAVIDVQMRTIRHGADGAGMDFTLIGTAVRVEGLEPSADPVIATVSALQFVRLLEAGIVPVGLAVGAAYDWLGGFCNWPGGERLSSGGGFAMTNYSDVQVKLQSWTSQPITVLGDFWTGIRRQAHAELRRNAATQGNGVLAHTHFGQLLRRERDKQPPAYLGRHIVIGTVVDTPRHAPMPKEVEIVLDMAAETGLMRGAVPRSNVYSGEIGEGEGPI